MISSALQHINTTDFGSPPVIDPKWLNNEFGMFLQYVVTDYDRLSADLQLLLAGFRLLSKVGDTAPLANIIKSASFPIGAMNESAVIRYEGAFCSFLFLTSVKSFKRDCWSK